MADPASAVACGSENRILRRIAPGSFEDNGGLFVALTEEDMDRRPGMLAACQACGIPTRALTAAQALALEPGLNPALKAAVWVPDATMDAMRLPLRFFATARQNGAELGPFTEVVGLQVQSGRVSGVAVRDHLTGRDAKLEADLVVNATGPWCGRLAAMAGAALPVRPSAGVLVALEGRLCDLVITRLHPAGDGDIVVPQRVLSIVGTSAWAVADPDDLEVPEERVQLLRREGAKLVPAVAAAAEWAVWAAAWPLVDAAVGAGGQELSQTFWCVDHAATDGIDGLVTITGARPPPCGSWPRRPPTWSAESSGSTPPAAPARSCSRPTPPTGPGGQHEQPQDRAAGGLPLPPGRRGPAVRGVPGAGGPPHHRPGRPAGRPPPPRP